MLNAINLHYSQLCFCSWRILPSWRLISSWRRSISFWWWLISSWWCCLRAAICSRSFFLQVRMQRRELSMQRRFYFFYVITPGCHWRTTCTHLKYISSSAACLFPNAPPASLTAPPPPPPFPAPFPSSPSFKEKERLYHIGTCYYRNTCLTYMEGVSNISPDSLQDWIVCILTVS